MGQRRSLKKNLKHNEFDEVENITLSQYVGHN